MTRKHFEAVAKVIDQEQSLATALGHGTARQSVLAVALGLAQVFGDANPRFDRDKFLNACGFPRV